MTFIRAGATAAAATTWSKADDGDDTGKRT